MKAICAILLVSVMFGLTSPVDFRAAFASNGGKKVIVNIDVCNRGHVVVCSDVDAPFIHSSVAITLPLIAAKRFAPVHPVMALSLLVYPREYPPEA